MRWFAEGRARLWALVQRRRADRELAEELAFHVDMETERLRASGLSPAEARRRALVALGRMTQTVEDTRDARGVRWLEDLARDVRHALRQLARAPAFTAAAVITLALGIGATTAIVSVIDGVLLRRVPYADADDLVMVWETDRRSGTLHEPGAWPDYVDLKARTRTLAGLAAFRGGVGTLTPEHGEPVRLAGVLVTHDYFPLLGVSPLLGRGFTDAEDRPAATRVALLGETLWRSRYGADPGAVGRAIRLDGEEYLVVGVMPDAADFGLDQIHGRADYHADYLLSGPVDVWLPNAASEGAFSRDTHPFLMIGRRAPGASLDAARDELAAIAADLETAYPRSNAARGIHVESLDAVVFGPIRPVLLLLAVAAGLVLLVAAVNVANLLLARGASRAHEVALRGALGAGAGRLGRQFLVEALVLALLGATVGVLLGHAGLGTLAALMPNELPRAGAIGLDGRVLSATLVVTLGVGIGFGLVPLAQARRLDPISVIRSEGPGGAGTRSGTRLREALVVGQLALSVALVTSAGLLARSLWTVLQVDPGFDVTDVVKAEYQLPASRYPLDFGRWPDLPEIHGFNARLLDRAREIPGVVSIGLAGTHPLDRGFTNSFQIVGREVEARDWPEISVRLVTPGYFATLGVRRIAGRLLEEGDDTAAPPVALLNEAARARFFTGGHDPVGQEIRFWGRARRIVGVVANERVHGLAEEAPPATYVPVAQAPRPGGVLLVRSESHVPALGDALRRAIHDVDPELAVYGVEPLATTLRASVADRRFAAVLIGLFAGMTVVLALVGVHGVVAFATAQRTREIGVRVALGATRGDVAGLVVREGVRLGTLGTALGLAGAWTGSGLLAGLLFGVAPLDPVTFAAVPAAVLAATALAAWIPARRAARADPTAVLRGVAGG